MRHDPGRTRTCNPRLRRPMPYPLGHGASCHTQQNHKTILACIHECNDSETHCVPALTPVGFEPTQLALVELESTPLDHSGKVSCQAAETRQNTCAHLYAFGCVASPRPWTTRATLQRISCANLFNAVSGDLAAPAERNRLSDLAANAHFSVLGHPGCTACKVEVAAVLCNPRALPAGA